MTEKEGLDSWWYGRKEMLRFVVVWETSKKSSRRLCFTCQMPKGGQVRRSKTCCLYLVVRAIFSQEGKLQLSFGRWVGVTRQRIGVGRVGVVSLPCLRSGCWAGNPLRPNEHSQELCLSAALRGFLGSKGIRFLNIIPHLPPLISGVRAQKDWHHLSTGGVSPSVFLFPYIGTTLPLDLFRTEN